MKRAILALGVLLAPLLAGCHNDDHKEGFLIAVASDSDGTPDGTPDGGPSINNAPSFTGGSNQTVTTRAGAQTVTGWATDIDDGDGGGQSLSFNVTTTTGSNLFAVEPTVSPSGTLSYTVNSSSQTGDATVQVVLQDDGGTDNGGADTSDAYQFTITVTDPGNNAPSFTGGSSHTASLNVSQVFENWATDIDDGDSGVDQDLWFEVTTTDKHLFAVQPTVSPSGKLSYTTHSSNTGVATLEVVLKDNGGTQNDGRDTSGTDTFKITVVADTNNLPTFDIKGDVVAAIGAKNVERVNWASAISKGGNGGPELEKFEVISNSNPGLFSTPPTVDVSSGTLSFSLADGEKGSATIQLHLLDTAGTSSLPQRFRISATELAGNADLESLTLSTGEFDQPFGPDQTELNTTVGYLAASVQVTAVPVNPAASVTINDEAVSDYDNFTSSSIALPVGETEITIVVTAQDGTEKTYTVTVTRESLQDFGDRAADYIKASNAGASDEFGYSVALSGDTLVVGAYLEDSDFKGVKSATELPTEKNDSAINSGAVYVFTRTSSGWDPQAYLKASNAEAYDQFGFSVALSGDTLAVGARYEDSNGSGTANNGELDAGAVYVFTRTGTTWTEQAYLKASNADAYDQFGFSVALSGDTLAVGAIKEDSDGNGGTAEDAGAVYVFTRDTVGNWGQQGDLIKGDNTYLRDQFGYSVALSDNTLAVGAYNEDSDGSGEDDNDATGAGAVYVFTRDTDGNWVQQDYLKNSNPEEADHFGASVALSGDTLVVGAPDEDSDVTEGGTNAVTYKNTGAVYVFTRTGVQWDKQAHLKAENAGANDHFGTSVTVSGDTLVVGAPSEDSEGTGVDGSPKVELENAGAVYVFTRTVDSTDGAKWEQRGYLKAENAGLYDQFGTSVALSGDTLAVGANQEDSDGPDKNDDAQKAGAVYVFE